MNDCDFVRPGGFWLQGFRHFGDRKEGAAVAQFLPCPGRGLRPLSRVGGEVRGAWMTEALLSKGPSSSRGYQVDVENPGASL